MAVHRFKPEVYWNTIGSHAPALHVNSGDTVETTTVDARGWDEQGEQAAARGNPMTGPIYVNGAEPGDTLAVRFDSIVPNRSWAWASDVLAPNVVDPEYLAKLPAANICRWNVNAAEGYAELDQAEGSYWAGRRLPLRPFLGCFGVAPARGQAISTSTSGEHGGNMDYRGFVAGVTAYFPVFAEGALLHLGDGHAVQGDGEIAGTGLEISMNVTFTVYVLKGRKSGWPRGETADHIFTVGNAKPLDYALQYATTEMLIRLTGEYGLSAQDASQLLGQTVEYDVANIYNPAYSLVCKIHKRWLPDAART
ncbi:acetamidase/formamidase family protein [Paenibacillus ginsengarvi]|uniref:Acetamidase n=1 Tax=Paenibacillus ginsengarvi TaxID=400777 RepID=A0A3B0CJF7_9BACL|nr:acetamidase/formamidase family protein [Paenibacillus ginsengarvi]RKN84467.1 acetamidase [Paenibacillus ginsengarvi]